MVEQDVPLTEALALAGQASGEPRTKTSADELGKALREGVPWPEALRDHGGNFPPLLRWQLAQATSKEGLASTLARASRKAHREALRKAEVLRVTLPFVLMTGVGGIATLVYLITLVAPWSKLLHGALYGGFSMTCAVKDFAFRASRNLVF